MMIPAPVPGVLVPSVGQARALGIVANYASPGNTTPVLHHYPLAGFRFRLEADRGSARRLHGRVIHTVADLRTGAVFSADPWQLDDGTDTPVNARPPVAAEHVIDLDTALATARQSVVQPLLKKVKLAASFRLVADEVIFPLWKPNWCVDVGSTRFLVDGLDGSVVSAPRVRVPAAG